MLMFVKMSVMVSRRLRLMSFWPGRSVDVSGAGRAVSAQNLSPALLTDGTATVVCKCWKTERFVGVKIP